MVNCVKPRLNIHKNPNEPCWETEPHESEKSRNMLKREGGKSSMPSFIPLLGTTFNREMIKGDFFGVCCLWLHPELVGDTRNFSQLNYCNVLTLAKLHVYR